MPCSLGPLGIYPGHLSEGTWPMLLGYRDEREGQQQESVLTESQSETFSISTPEFLSSTQTCAHIRRNEWLTNSISHFFHLFLLGTSSYTTCSAGLNLDLHFIEKDLRV